MSVGGGAFVEELFSPLGCVCVQFSKGFKVHPLCTNIPAQGWPLSKKEKY